MIPTQQVEHIVGDDKAAVVPLQAGGIYTGLPRHRCMSEADQRTGGGIAFGRDRQLRTADFLDVLLQPRRSRFRPHRRIVGDNDRAGALACFDQWEFWHGLYLQKGYVVKEKRSGTDRRVGWYAPENDFRQRLVRRQCYLCRLELWCPVIVESAGELFLAQRSLLQVDAFDFQVCIAAWTTVAVAAVGPMKTDQCVVGRGSRGVQMNCPYGNTVPAVAESRDLLAVDRHRRVLRPDAEWAVIGKPHIGCR